MLSVVNAHINKDYAPFPLFHKMSDAACAVVESIYRFRSYIAVVTVTSRSLWFICRGEDNGSHCIRACIQVFDYCFSHFG